MYDQTQFTPLYFIDRGGGWLNDATYFEMKRISGYAPETWYLYTQLVPESFFFGAYDIEALTRESRFGYKNFTNRKWVQKFERDVPEMYRQTKHISGLYFQWFHRKEKRAIVKKKANVIFLLEEIRKTMSFIMSHYIITQPQQFYKLEKLLRNKSDKRMEMVMNNARRLTHAMELRKAILECAIQTNGRRANTRRTMGTINKLGFLNWGLFGGELVNSDYLKKEASRLRNSPEKLREEFQQIRGAEARIRERNQILRSAKENKLMAAADIAGHSALLRFNMQIYSMCLMNYVQRIVNELRGHFKLKASDISAYEYDELIELLQEAKRVSPKMLANRKRGYLRIFTHKEATTHTGESAREKIKDLLLFRKEEFARVKPLQGTTASLPKGKTLVRGTAFVLTTGFNIQRELKNFRKGQIFVVTQTDPNMVPAIKNASAIVTDEGGITSHAAIVSRELGIPAIIGTRLATKMFKTGDTLILDFNKGVVMKS